MRSSYRADYPLLAQVGDFALWHAPRCHDALARRELHAVAVNALRKSHYARLRRRCAARRWIVVARLQYGQPMSRIFNVLLIEDDQVVQYAMVEGLTDAGHVVSVAGTLPRAIDALSNYHHFDVILLDLRLGEDRGEDIFLRLRAGEVPFPPVIIVSAQPGHEIRRVHELIEAADALQKPVSISDICVAMERAVA